MVRLELPGLGWPHSHVWDLRRNDWDSRSSLSLPPRGVPYLRKLTWACSKSGSVPREGGGKLWSLLKQRLGSQAASLPVHRHQPSPESRDRCHLFMERASKNLWPCLIYSRVISHYKTFLIRIFSALSRASWSRFKKWVGNWRSTKSYPLSPIFLVLWPPDGGIAKSTWSFQGQHQIPPRHALKAEDSCNWAGGCWSQRGPGMRT